MLPRVVVVGSFMQDLAFFARKFPKPGETVVGEFRSGPGGKGFNQAVAATRAGAPTLFIGAVGRDTFGLSAKKFATRMGLRAQFIEKHKYATGTAGITIDEHGQNQIVIAAGANLALHKHDVPLDALAPAHVVVCQGESDYLMVAHVLRHGRKAGAVTVLNPAPMRADFDVSILRHVEVLIPNESEFISLVRQHAGCAALLRSAAYREIGEFNESALHALKADALHRLCRCLQVPIVILTLGARGCFVSEPDAYLRMNAHPVEVIDSTGAGDAFVGGFAAGLVKFKKNVVEAAHYANAVAALAVMQPGTAEAMPNPREIARFLRERAHAVR
ncbi:MAG TPA: ribokinase [Acidobacteriota bacterium]|nr:ribokinase [Acidobacteriota bacterium]